MGANDSTYETMVLEVYASLGICEDMAKNVLCELDGTDFNITEVTSLQYVRKEEDDPVAIDMIKSNMSLPCSGEYREKLNVILADYFNYIFGDKASVTPLNVTLDENFYPENSIEQRITKVFKETLVESMKVAASYAEEASRFKQTTIVALTTVYVELKQTQPGYVTDAQRLYGQTSTHGAYNLKVISDGKCICAVEGLS